MDFDIRSYTGGGQGRISQFDGEGNYRGSYWVYDSKRDYQKDMMGASDDLGFWKWVTWGLVGFFLLFG